MSGPVIATGVIAAAQGAMAATRVPASSQLAQWALESAWGARAPGNNPFGIQHMAGFGDQRFLSHEVLHGRTVAITETFAVFASIDQAFLVHAHLIATRPVYAPAMAALPDLGKFVGLMAAHYATDPDYAAKILALIKQHDLTRYDAVKK